MTCVRSALILLLLTLLACSSITTASAVIAVTWPEWSELTPVVVDPSGDESANYDLVECYIASDDVFFYFKIRVLGTIVKSSIFVLLDTDRNANTGDDGTTPASLDSGGDLAQHHLGADYYLDPLLSADLWEWVGSWQWNKTVALQSDDPASMAIAVARADLGNPRSINVLFMANPPDTDYAPNHGYVTYPLQAVGGSVLPATPLLGLVLCLSLGAFAAAGLRGLHRWRRPGHN